MLLNGVISARSVVALVRSDIAPSIARSASSFADASVLDHPNASQAPKKRTATDVLERARKLRSEVLAGDNMPPSIAPSAPKAQVAPAGRVDPVHSAIYRDLNQMSTPGQILTHYRLHQDEYGIVNLSMAMNKIIKYMKTTRPWKAEAANKRLLDQMCYNSVAALRDALKVDRDYAERMTGSAEAGRQGDRPSRTHTLPFRTISSILHHLSKLQRCPATLLHEMSHVLQERVQEMDPMDVTQLAFAYAASNVPAPIFFNKIASHVSAHLDRYSDVQVIGVLTAYSNLKTAAPELFYRIAERLIARKEQAHTVTPRILASAVGSMAKGVMFDKELPTRLRKAMSGGVSGGDMGATGEEAETGKGALAMMYSHKETTARALSLLAPRIEAVARAHRVPGMTSSTTVDREAEEDKAFTAQGLVQVAWAYSTAYQVFAEVLHGPSQYARAAHMLVRDGRMGGSAGKEAAAATLKLIMQQGAKIVLQQDKWASPNIPDATVVSTISAVMSALTHPQTLSTASMSQLAIAAAALNAIRTKLLYRLTAVIGMQEMVEKMPVTAGSPSAYAVLEEESASLRSLLLQLSTRKHLSAIATAMITLLDPSTGGKAMEAKAAEGRAAVSGAAALERAAASEAASMQAAVVERLLERPKEGRGVRPGEVQAIAEALEAPEEGDFEAEAKEALALLHRQTGGSSEPLALGGGGTLAQSSDRAMAQLRAMGDKLAAEEEDEGALQREGEQAGAQAKYNPLAYQQAVVLGTPLSLHDIAEAASVYAECAPLLHVPELWAKMADRVEAGVLAAASGRAASRWRKPDEDYSYRGRRPMNTDWGNNTSLASTAPSTVSLLALSFMQAAPDVHAARVMKSIALTFALNSPRAPPALAAALAPLHEITHTSGGRAGEGASSSVGAAPLSSSSSVAVTPTYDESPTWLDQAKEALRRSRSWRKAPALPVHRLAGSPLPGHGLVEYEPAAGEPGADGLPGEGDPDEDLIAAAEAPSMVQHTETNWAARVLYRNSADGIHKLSLAAIMCCPPKPLQAQQDISLAMLQAQVQAMYADLEVAHPVEEAGDLEGTAELYTERLAQSLQVSRVATVHHASVFALPKSWQLREGPLGHETPAEYPLAQAALDAYAGGKEEQKKAIKYADQPILVSRRWARGLRPFTYAGVSDPRAQLGRADPRLAAVPDSTVRACLAYMMKNLCVRLGERTDGNEVSPEDIADCIATCVGRDYSVLQDPLSQLLDPLWSRMNKGKETPLYHPLLALQAQWLDKHLTSAQEAGAMKVADMRRVKDSLSAGRNTAAAHGKAGPWLPMLAAKGAETYQPPTHLKCSLHVYGQMAVAFGASLWDRLVQSDFRLTPKVLDHMRHQIRVLLVLCDEASRRMALDTRQGKALEHRHAPPSSASRQGVESTEVDDTGSSTAGLRMDNALSTFASMVACAVTPLALASVPTGTKISAEHVQRATALRKISRRFIELAAAGAAVHIDPRKLNLNQTFRVPVQTVLDDSGVVQGVASPQGRQEAPAIPRAVLRASVAAVTLHAYSLVSILQQSEEALVAAAVEQGGKEAVETVKERMQ